MKENHCINGEACPINQVDSEQNQPCVKPECRIKQALKMIDGKWKLPIICTLGDQTMRFNELKREIVGITSMMLTSSLKELEECGIVHRESYHEVPPKVEYSLTDGGLSLTPILFDLGHWGHKLNTTKEKVNE
ncbi:helix-turn-helix domain-containing protein [Acetobacterium wieringae]|uniref:winged helix-turn-helix transcriptional regulator n=1 Tax=Acetobacterium wieringae TaxID=52694 RepID=UPI0026E99B79|nr:helix-turn-helix domain-containing protein [Acetobacterium wieringae]